jgi:hypothetical protein
VSTAPPPVPDIAATREGLLGFFREFKKGYRTTEFWGSKIALLIPVLAFGGRLFGYDVDEELLQASLAGLIPEVGYILSRGWVKKQRNVTVAEVAKTIGTTVSSDEIVQQVLEALGKASPIDEGDPDRPGPEG